MAVAEINRESKRTAKDALKKAQEAEIPASLSRQLKKAMQKRPDEPWDLALFRIAEAQRRRSR